MKTIELQKKLFDLVGLNIEEFTKAEELTPEQTEQATAALGNILTVEAAKNNVTLREQIKNEYYPVLKKHILNNVDKNLEQLVREIFGEDKYNELVSVDSTDQRIKRIHEWYTESLKETKGVDEKLKTTIDHLKKQVEQITSENEDKLKQKDEIIRTKEQEFTGKLLKGQIFQMAHKYDLADPYKDDLVRNAILETMWQELNGKATVKFNEQGEIELKAKEDPNVDLYKDNKRLGVKDLIEPFLSPYLKKADPPTKRTGQQSAPGPKGNLDELPPALRHMREKQSQQT